MKCFCDPMDPLERFHDYFLGMFGNFIKDPREVAVDSCIHTRNIFGAAKAWPKAEGTNKLGHLFKYGRAANCSGYQDFAHEATATVS